jgi:redox-regulated HSP33 family molecular chaperone
MLEELLEEARVTGRTELSCEFCGDRFNFDADEMETLLADARAKETGGG